MGVSFIPAQKATTGSPLIGADNTPATSNPSIQAVQDRQVYIYKAKALYSYPGSPYYSDELFFVQDEILDILEDKYEWWQARKTDGTIGIAPSNYLRMIAGSDRRSTSDLGSDNTPTSSGASAEVVQDQPTCLFQAKALYSYSGSPDHSDVLSFSEGQILDILDDKNINNWWQARKTNGVIGIVPSHWLSKIDNFIDTGLNA